MSDDASCTVGGLRAAMEQAADETPIIVESFDGQRFVVERASLWGTRTDEPFLRVLVRHDD